MVRLRIATLNCLNLASAGSRIYDGFAPFTPDEYIARTQWLAQLLDRMAADIVLLQEVFHEQALSDVVRQTAAQGRDLSFAAPFADAANTKPRLAIIWRAPLAVQVESVAALPCAPVPVAELGEVGVFSRPVLRAVVPLAAAAAAPVPLTLLNVHLKSRRAELLAGEDAADPLAYARGQLRALTMRAAEATGVRRLVVEAVQPRGDPLVVAGDFNDSLYALTTRIVTGASSHANEGPGRQSRLFDAWAAQHEAPNRGREVAYSIVDDGVPECIDHLFVSDAFVAGGRQRVGRVDRVEIYADHLTERCRATAAAALDPAAPDLGRIYPDHAGLCATLVFGA
jgi:endonuclease/exonuclease/phosphatase family metal-dependent hydrolase